MMLQQQLTIEQFLQSLAAKTPAPGGGSVAAITGALAAALGEMVLQYSIGKKALASHDAAHRQALAQLGDFRTRLLQLADEDARAYARLNTLSKLDSNDPARVAEYPHALFGAINAPKAMLEAALESLRVFRALSGTTNHHLNSDLGIAAILAESAVRAAAWNVRVNLPELSDATLRTKIQDDLSNALDAAHSLAAEIEKACAMPVG